MMKIKKTLKVISIVTLVLVILLLSTLLIFISSSINEVKKMDITLNTSARMYSRFYDNDGKIINNIKYNDDYITLDKMNKQTIQAFISIEDKDFYKHHGLNYKRIIKAAINNIKTGTLKEGASTITQQLVKNKFLSRDKTFKRKIQEAYLSKKLEHRESKNKILETYLNTIYFGNGAYGINNASKMYFNKEASELNLNESCVLAGIINSPAKYSPITNINNALNRRNLVLQQMKKDNYITDEEYSRTIEQDIELDITDITKQPNLYIDYCIDELEDIMKLNKNQILHGNYDIYTYQETQMQNDLNNILSDDKYYQKNMYGNIADSQSIIIDNQTHSVSAISGRSKYNLVNIKRQPGSLIKPIIVYTPAIEQLGISPKSEILDEKIDYDGYSPNNVGNVYHGYVSIRDAVAQSLNIPAVKLTKELGIDSCKNYGLKCGIQFDDNDIGYSIALGGLTQGTTLKDVTDAYSTFNNNGSYAKSTFIKKIKINNKLSVYTRKNTITNVFLPESSYIMTDILKYATKNGTSKKLSKFSDYLASKTGTVNLPGSNLNTDAYSLGVTTEHIVCTWLGNYSMESEYHLNGNNNGGTYATEINKSIFDNLYSTHTPEDFNMPSGVVSYPIDAKTLSNKHIILSGKNIPERYIDYDLFNENNLPDDNNSTYSGTYEFDYTLYKQNNKVYLSFDLIDMYKYDIYKVVNNKSILLYSIKNKTLPNYKYIDNSAEANGLLEYYIVATNQFDDTYYFTPHKYIYLENTSDSTYNESINIDSNYNWIF